MQYCIIPVCLRKKKASKTTPLEIEELAFIFVGLWDGSRLSVLHARSRGFNSLQVHLNRKILPANRGNHSRGNVLGYEPTTGL